MTAARSDDVHRNALVEQQSFMAAAEIMEAELGEAELAGPVHEIPRHRVRVPQLGQIGPVTAGEHQRVVGQPHQREIDGHPIRHAGHDASMPFPLDLQQFDQAVIDRDGSSPAAVFGSFVPRPCFLVSSTTRAIGRRIVDSTRSPHKI
jgi:hypothetical protein